jgi:hypothetical protein
MHEKASTHFLIHYMKGPTAAPKTYWKLPNITLVLTITSEYLAF